MNQNPLISIVIPAYNEEIRLRSTLESLAFYTKKQNYKYEIIIVDDGSADNTASVANAFEGELPNLRVLSYPKNKGKGYAVKFGFVNSLGDLVLMADADGATPIEELERLLPYIEKGADIVIGSRAVKSEEVVLKTLPHRKIMGRIFNFFVDLVLGLSLKDTQCGFKLFRRESSMNIFSKQTLDGFGFDVELLFLARQQNLKIEEVPISWGEVSGSKVNLISDPLKMFFDLVVIRINQLKGQYRTK